MPRRLIVSTARLYVFIVARMKKTLTASIITLGCRLNQADSALISDRLMKLGFEIVPHDAEASPNLIVVNTCTVTAVAFKKARQALRSLRAENPGAFIVATGCAADVDRATLDRSDECDLILSNEQKKDIDRILPRYLSILNAGSEAKPARAESPDGIFFENARGVFPFRSRAFVKIQEGCDNACSYCIVPQARGKERSRDLGEIVAEVESCVQQGFHEIVLAGVNTCRYRCGETDLPRLLERLFEIPGDWRVRLSSTEPGAELPELIDVMAKRPDRVCSFLHLPLQSGCDRILKAMNRKCSLKQYSEYVALARKTMSNVHIGTDLIVGFPGETQKDFDATLSFLRKTCFANIHIFPFSPRKGTAADSMPGRVPPEIMAERIAACREIKEESALNFKKSLLGSTERVLIETRRSERAWEGWSGNYVRTRVFSSERVLEKKLVKVRFLRIADDGAVEAELLETE